MDKNEFFEEVAELINDHTEELTPFDVIAGLITLLAVFVEGHAANKQVGMSTIEIYKDCLEKAYSVKNETDSV